MLLLALPLALATLLGAGAAPVPAPPDPQEASDAASALLVAALSSRGAVAVAPVCTVPETVEPGRMIACYTFLAGDPQAGFMQISADQTIVYLDDAEQFDRSIVPASDADLLAAWDTELARILSDTAKRVISGPDAASQLGFTVSNIDCGRPASVEVGATFTCTGFGDGQLWRFGAKVDGLDHITVESVDPVGSTSPAPSGSTP